MNANADLVRDLNLMDRMMAESGCNHVWDRIKPFMRLSPCTDYKIEGTRDLRPLEDYGNDL